MLYGKVVVISTNKLHLFVKYISTTNLCFADADLKISPGLASLLYASVRTEDIITD